MVCDSLQRHTLALKSDLSEDEAYRKSIEEGDAWLLRNQSSINLLTIPHRIQRWDEWLKHLKYSSKCVIINLLYSNFSDFRCALDAIAKDFVWRHKMDDRCIGKSKLYLKEEMAIFLIWAELKYYFVFYPQRITSSFKIIYRYLVEKYYSDFF